MTDKPDNRAFIGWGWANFRHSSLENLHLGPRAKVMATRSQEDYGGEIVRVAIYEDPEPTT